MPPTTAEAPMGPQHRGKPPARRGRGPNHKLRTFFSPPPTQTLHHENSFYPPNPAAYDNFGQGVQQPHVMPKSLAGHPAGLKSVGAEMRRPQQHVLPVRTPRSKDGTNDRPHTNVRRLPEEVPSSELGPAPGGRTCVWGHGSASAAANTTTACHKTRGKQPTPPDRRRRRKCQPICSWGFPASSNRIGNPKPRQQHRMELDGTTNNKHKQNTAKRGSTTPHPNGRRRTKCQPIVPGLSRLLNRDRKPETRHATPNAT